jgi:Icc-related predicted phosphoesterase
MVTRIERNIHKIDLPDYELAIFSDLHWDNPKCDRVKLKKHLDYCLERKIPVFINGDLFCLMQGRYDGRSNKSDILPEHNKANYLDAIITTAVEWFSPYASILTVIGYGNHETNIIKRMETDMIQRFVDLMNYKNGTNIQSGGYGGWLVLKVKIAYTNAGAISVKCKYFHGSGGGGIVTKGAINLTRAMEMYEGMDVFILGHIHENWARNDVRDMLKYNPGKHKYEMTHHNIHHCITGTYKDDYDDGAFGWANEKGMPPKPLGGRILKLTVIRHRPTSKTELIETLIDSMKFPI